MCGIAGIISNDKLTQRDRLNYRLMMSKISHRGNFEDEPFEGRKAIIGTHRLPINDEENGKQPVKDKTSQILSVFNGEIYNFDTIKCDLQKLGVEIPGNCDSSILSDGYRIWGDHFFNRLDGMFVVCFYNQSNNEICCVRDPIGIKPLYYAYNDQKMYFASEIKALSDLKDFEVIKELNPGEILRNGKISKMKTRRILEEGVKEKYQCFDDSYLGCLKDLFSDSVKKRVNTNLEIGIFLGGLDSAILLHEVLKYKKKNKIKVITAAKNKNSDDLVFAKNVCKEFGLNLEILYLNECDLINSIEETIYAIESFEPNHIRGGTISLMLAKKAKELGLKIILVGEGADEIFGGYPEFYLNKNMASAKLFQQFILEIYKTQLKRVDRTSMQYTLETRVPYLSIDFVVEVLKISATKKIESVIEKSLLRLCYKNYINGKILNTKKRVLSEGAGFSSNSEQGVFWENANRKISDKEEIFYKKKYNEYNLRNKEEVLYFKIFAEYFDIRKLDFLKQRPNVNRRDFEAKE